MGALSERPTGKSIHDRGRRGSPEGVHVSGTRSARPPISVSQIRLGCLSKHPVLDPSVFPHKPTEQASGQKQGFSRCRTLCTKRSKEHITDRTSLPIFVHEEPRFRRGIMPPIRAQRPTTSGRKRRVRRPSAVKGPSMGDLVRRSDSVVLVQLAAIARVSNPVAVIVHHARVFEQKSKHVDLNVLAS